MINPKLKQIVTHNKYFISALLLAFTTPLTIYFSMEVKAFSPSAADFSGNGSVGSEDLTILNSNWGQRYAYGSDNSPNGPGDANRDGVVNILDMSAVAGQWGSRNTVVNRYVSKRGSDSNNGTADNPWLTIQKAANSVIPGETVVIETGTYNERVIIPSSASGNTKNTTKFIAQGNVVVTQAFVINSDYTELEGFEITPGSSSITDNQRTVGQLQVNGNQNILKRLNIHDLVRGTAITISPGKSYNTIEDCVITTPRQGGVGSSNDKLGPSYTTVRNTVISKWAGEVGIDTVGDHWTLDNVTLRGVTTSDYQNSSVQNGDGIWANNSSNNVIKNSKIYDIWPHNGFRNQHADCIQVWTNTTGLLIENTVIGSWKPGGADGSPGPTMGIMLGTVSDGSTIDITIRNSLFLMGIAPNTHPTASGRTNGTINVTLINNTFFSNYPELGNITRITARNNIFYSHRGFGGILDSDYNAFLWEDWENGASTINSGEGAHSLGRTQAARLRATDVFVNPDVSASTNYGLNANFRPKSVLLRAGDPLYTLAYDLMGITRSSPPSIGAYE